MTERTIPVVLNIHTTYLEAAVVLQRSDSELKNQVEGKAILKEAWTDPEGSRKMRL
jgi:hypothetical protein